MSAAVENTCDFLVGIVVFLSIILVNTLPRVSIPNESGVTSSRSISFTSPVSTPACIEAPAATHSSGLIPLCGSLFINFLTASCTAGILVEPPTSSTSSISDTDTPASLIACSVGPIVLATSSAVNSLNLALVKSIFKCFGPSAVAVMNGRFIFVVIVEESSFLAFSAASFNL